MGGSGPALSGCWCDQALRVGQSATHGHFGRITPTGTITEFSVPTAQGRAFRLRPHPATANAAALQQEGRGAPVLNRMRAPALVIACLLGRSPRAPSTAAVRDLRRASW